MPSKSNVEVGANRMRALENRVVILENWYKGVQNELNALKQSKKGWWGAEKYKRSKRKSKKKKKTRRRR